MINDTQTLQATQEETTRLRQRIAELEQCVADFEQTRADLRLEQERNQALQQQLWCLQQVIDDAPQPIGVRDTAGMFRVVNKAVARSFGLTHPEAMVGRKIDDFFPPEMCTRLYTASAHICTTGEVMHDEYVRVCQDKPHTLLQTQFPIRDEHGNVWAIGSIATDITAYKQSEEQLRKLFERAVEQSPVCVVITDTSGVIEYVNPKFTQLTGYTTTEVLGMNPRILKSGDMTPELYAQLWRTITSGNEWHGEFRNIKKNGESYWEQASISPIYDADGNITHFVGVKEDITERKHAHAQLQRLNQQLTCSVAELEQHNREMTLLNRLSSFLQRCESVEKAYDVILPLLRELFAHQSGALYMMNAEHTLLERVAAWGAPPPTERVLAPDACWAFAGGRMHLIDDPRDELVCQHIGTAQAFPSLCIQLTTKGESVGLLHLRRVPITSEQARIHWERLAMMVADTLALALTNLHLQERLRQQAILDSLTGLFNRHYLDEILNREFRRATRHCYPVGIIMLDIDHFKQYNDTYGHHGGDALLRALGPFLKAHIRGEDVACRYGGEEIILVLPGASLHDLRRRAEALCMSIRELCIEHNGQALGNVTASFGVASFPQHGRTAQAVITAADTALYRAKATGRNRVQVAEEMTTEIHYVLTEPGPSVL